MQPALEGIEQAAKYALSEGVQLCVVTDGEKWIFFKPFVPGTNYKEKEAIVFPNLNAIQSDFSQYFELFSKKAHREGRYKVIFDQIHGGRLLLSTGLHSAIFENEIHPIQKTSLAFDLERVFEKYFSHLVGADDPSLAIECFVESRESRLADFSLEKLLTNVLGNMNPDAVDVNESLRDVVQSAVSYHEGETIFIVGPTGSGKTTFLDRFFKRTLPDQIQKHCLVVNINLLDATGTNEIAIAWLTEQSISSIERNLYGDSGPSWDQLRGLYYSEYTKRKHGIDAQLYARDPSAFREKFSEFLEKAIQQDREEYLRKLLNDIVSNRKMLPVFILDNTDEFTLEFKIQIFQYVQSLRRSISYCLIIFPVTDKSAWQLSKTEIFNIYGSRSFFLPTPSPREVFRKRIEYLRQRLEKENPRERGSYDLSSSLRVSIDNLGAFASAVEDIFVDHELAAGWIGALSNYNIRSTLVLARRIITSPELKIEDVLATYLAKSDGMPSSNKLMKALVKGDYNYYHANDRHLIFPIFGVDEKIRQSPLLNLRILAVLQSTLQSGDTAEAKCMSIASILSYFDAMGHAEAAVEAALLKIFMERLVEPYDASDQSLSSAVRLSITQRGVMHLNLAVFNSVFFEQLALTMRITDPEVAREMRKTVFSSAPYSQQMGSLRAQFAHFLIKEDARFGVVPDAPQFNCQKLITTDLKRYCNQDFEHPSERLLGNRLLTKANGIVDWFDKDKGYGFVSFEGDYGSAFLHITTLQAASVDEVADGDLVVCDVGKGQKGISVTRVHSVQSPKASEGGFIDAKIVRLRRDRRYGFVHAASLNIDAFFHFSVVDESRLSGLREGASVRVELNKDPKGRGFQVRRLVA